jgi:hypothetical protein
MINGKRTLVLTLLLAVAVAVPALIAPHASALTLAQK